MAPIGAAAVVAVGVSPREIASATPNLFAGLVGALDVAANRISDVEAGHVLALRDVLSDEGGEVLLVLGEVARLFGDLRDPAVASLDAKARENGQPIFRAGRECSEGMHPGAGALLALARMQGQQR